MHNWMLAVVIIHQIKSRLLVYPHSYLPPVMIHIRVPRVDLCGHVEILCREHRLLLLHVHAATLDQRIGPQL